MKLVKVLSAAVSLLLHEAFALETPDLSPRGLEARDYQIQEFEKRFLDTIDWEHDNHTVKLVGYKKIIMTDAQLGDLEHRIKTYPQEWHDFSAAFYDPRERTMRVYFPVENALVYHGKDLVEATHMGEFPLHDKLHSNCQVVGRYQTEQVHGTSGNRIENGIVYLHEPAAPVRVYGDKQNILMYDFGWREGQHAHGDDGHSHGRSVKRDKGEKKGGSCRQNHGGKTCSQVYKINHGRCPRDYSSCIDYNGWRPNCKNKSSKWAFPGSDCYTAVARGHCWNEIPH